MTLRVTPETVRLVQGEIQSGHFTSVDDGSQAESLLDAPPEVRGRAVERIRELRKGVRMKRDDMTLREFAHLGHRY